MPFFRCREYDDDGKPTRGGCLRQGAGCDFIHPSEPAWSRALRRSVLPRTGSGLSGLGRGKASERGHWRGGPPTGPRRGSKPFSSAGRGASTSGGVASASSSWGMDSISWGFGDDNAGESSTSWDFPKWGDNNDNESDKGKGKDTEATWGSLSGDWGSATSDNTGASWGNNAAVSWGDSAAVSWGDHAGVSWGDNANSWGSSDLGGWGDPPSKSGTSATLSGWGESAAPTSSTAAASSGWGNPAVSSTTASSSTWGESAATSTAAPSSDWGQSTSSITAAASSGWGKSTTPITTTPSSGWGQPAPSSIAAASENWGEPAPVWGSSHKDDNGESAKDVSVSSSSKSDMFTSNSQWGQTPSSTSLGRAAEPTERASTADKGRCNPVISASASSLSSAPSRRVSTNPAPDEREKKRPRVDTSVMQTTANPDVMDMDTQRSPTVPVSAMGQAKFDSATPLSAVMRPSSVFSTVEDTPNSSVPSSRSTSLCPLPATAFKEPRTLKNISCKQARLIWRRHIGYLSHLQRLKAELSDAEECVRNYNSMQRSHRYDKLSNSGLEMYKEEGRKCLRKEKDRRKAYVDALNALCKYEEGFDFPIQALVRRKADERGVWDEIVIVKKYLKEAKSYVHSARANAEEIEHCARRSSESHPANAVDTDSYNRIRAELTERIERLEERASEVSQAMEDIKGDVIDNMVDTRLEDFKLSFPELLNMDVTDEQDMVSEKILWLIKEVASIRDDIRLVADEAAGLVRFFKNLRKNMEEMEEKLQDGQRLLNKERQLLREKQRLADTLRATLVKSSEDLEHVRQYRNAIRQTPSVSHPSVQDVTTDENVNRLFAMLLGPIREHSSAAVILALETLKSNLTAHVEESNKKKYAELYMTIRPIIKVASDVHAKLDRERRCVTTRSRPASPHFGEARLGAVAHTTHT
ncbi:hypothetical protein DFH11DRAFT_1575742 [Phellopilus nigrolimitatus]|nr:hypothetical protein DFH11DRAFT_1575742 [Phellopilus nigrolimitatus]